MENYVESQWSLLLQYELADQPEIVEASKRGIESFARSIVRSDTELIFAVDSEGALGFSSDSEFEPSSADLERLRRLYDEEQVAFGTITLAGTERVYTGTFFEPYQWLMLTTESRTAFFADANRITLVTGGRSGYRHPACDYSVGHILWTANPPAESGWFCYAAHYP